MNSQNSLQTATRRRKATKELWITLVVGIVLLVVSAQVFSGTDNAIETTAQTEKEKKISLLLREMEGVGESSVMICETEDGVQSVVVVCEGANNLQVVLNVREAVSAALGTNQAAVKIYLKKE